MKAMDRGPVILEVALNGLTSPSHNDAVPTTSGELTGDALACIDEGAAVDYEARAVDALGRGTDDASTSERMSDDDRRAQPARRR
jgi:uncharacterized protein (DUF849 family)